MYVCMYVNIYINGYMYIIYIYKYICYIMYTSNIYIWYTYKIYIWVCDGEAYAALGDYPLLRPKSKGKTYADVC